MLATGFQHDIHKYLAHLKTPPNADPNSEEPIKPVKGYKLPDHPAFQPLIAPHYMAECLIYLAIAINAAPQGEWINKTLSSALVFVVVNLAVSAQGTKEWYERVFGKESTRGKWRMIPPVY